MALTDPNFESFVRNWRNFRERFVVFLGAGASVGARNRANEPLPNAYELRNHLWKEFKLSPGERFVASKLGLVSLEHAAGIIETDSGRRALSDSLVKKFTCTLPLWQHVALPYLKPRSIFTTNYDELVELGYKSHPEVPDIICEYREPTPGRMALYKPHGSLGNARSAIGKGGLVITQFDYFEMISDYRKMLAKSMSGFGESCVIIAGYSFGDMDIGAELYAIRKKDNDTPWYAIFPRDDPQVRQMYASRLNIRQISATLEQFLAELDGRVEFIDDRHKFEKKAALRSAGLIQ
jgi:hypothetical protein